MGTASSVRRQFAIALTLLYLVMVGGVPLAHAGGEASGPSDAVHMVAWGEDQCPPVHDHAHCPACKLTGSQLVGAPSALVRFEWPDRPAGIHSLKHVVDLPSSPVATPRSRGPPHA